ALLDGELVERPRVGEPAGDGVDQLDVVIEPPVLGADLRTVARVVPQVGLGHLRFEGPQARPLHLDGEVPARRRQPALERRQVLRHVAHGRQRPWQSLYFLPLPHQHGSLRPILSCSERLACRPPLASSDSAGPTVLPATPCSTCRAGRAPPPATVATLRPTGAAP